MKRLFNLMISLLCAGLLGALGAPAVAQAAAPESYITFSSGISATQKVTNDDGVHYRVEVTVKNTTTSSLSWTATLSNQVKLTNLWGASQTTSNGITTIKSPSALAAGASYGWGYEADRVSTSAAPVISLSPTSLSFGNQTVNTASSAQTITVKNTGSATMSLSGLTLSGTNAAEFSASGCGSSLAAGASCSLTVNFKPTSTGSKSATLKVNSNASSGTSTASLSGTGVTSTSSSGSSTATSYLTMGAGFSVTQKVTSDDGTHYRVEATVTNTGTATATWTATLSNDVTLTNLWGASWKTVNGVVTLTGSGSVAAGKTASWGYEANRKTPASTGSAVIALSTTSLAFGDQTVGTTSSGKTVTITNSGTATLSISSISLTGTNAADFTQTSCASSLSAGASCVMTVAFKPTASGTRTASLAISSNASSGPSSVALSGNGVQASSGGSSSDASSYLSFSPASSLSVTQKVTNDDGVHYRVEVTVKNIGSSSVTWTATVSTTVKITNLWGASQSTSNGVTTIKAPAALAAGASQNWGYEADRVSTTTPPPPSSDDGNTTGPTQGFQAINGSIYDASGKRVQIRGLSMFGFNADILIPQYLWTMGWKQQIQQVKDLGFNAIRVPYVPDTLYSPTPGYFDPLLNPEFVGKTPLQIMDIWLAELDRQGLYFMLDFHSVSKVRQNPTWYTTDTTITYNGQQYTEDNWVRDLVFVAQRYANLPHFMGIDLYNEPNGVVRWGQGDPNQNATASDWKRASEKAATAVINANPNLLVFVQGINGNWDGIENSNIPMNWGEDLQPQDYLPLSVPNNKLVFSPHTYGPDVYMKSTFYDPSFPNNLAKDWETLFGYLYPKHPMIIGEFGGYYGTGPSGNMDKQWQDALVDYLIGKGIDGGFYWCYTPNSGDTGGILNNDLTVRTDKMNLLKRLWGW